MSEIKTWQGRCLERGIGSCEARDEELIELRAALKERDAEIEQLRVQLAGCGVAAMQNTEASKADRVKPGDYGWSESYGDVCRAVDREIELRAKLAALEGLYLGSLAAATQWQLYKARKDAVIVAGMGRKAMRDAAAGAVEKEKS